MLVLKLLAWLSAVQLSRRKDCRELMWLSWGGTTMCGLAAKGVTFPCGVQLGRANCDLQP